MRKIIFPRSENSVPRTGSIIGIMTMSAGIGGAATAKSQTVERQRSSASWNLGEGIVWYHIERSRSLAVEATEYRIVVDKTLSQPWMIAEEPSVLSRSEHQFAAHRQQLICRDSSANAAPLRPTATRFSPP